MLASIKAMLESEKFSLLMFISILCYVFFKDSVKVVADFFQTIMVFGGLTAIYVYRGFFVRNVVFLLLLLGCGLQVISWFLSKISIPEFAQAYPNIKPFSYLMVFLIIAFWLKGSLKKSILVLFTFSLGSIFTLVYHSDFIVQFANGANGDRVDFGYRNAQHGSLIIGAAFIVFFWFIYAAFTKHIKNKMVVISCLLLVFVFLGFLLMMLQSRQSWLAVIMALLFVPWIYSSLSGGISWLKVALFYVGVLLCGLLVFQVGFVSERVYAGFTHSGDINEILSGNWKNVKDISIGVRLQTWLEAINWFFAHPWFGTGDGSRILVITQSNSLPDYIKAEFRHLHNSNFETVVSYGICGFVFIYIMMFYPFLKVMKSQVDFFIKALAASFFIYWLVVNNFESFFYLRSGQWVFNTFAGAIYTFSLYSDFIEYQTNRRLDN